MNILDMRPHTCTEGPLCNYFDFFHNQDDDPYCAHDSCSLILHSDCLICLDDGNDMNAGVLDPMIAALQLPPHPDDDDLDCYFYSIRNIDHSIL